MTTKSMIVDGFSCVLVIVAIVFGYYGAAGGCALWAICRAIRDGGEL